MCTPHNRTTAHNHTIAEQCGLAIGHANQSHPAVRTHSLHIGQPPHPPPPPWYTLTPSHPTYTLSSPSLHQPSLTPFQLSLSPSLPPPSLTPPSIPPLLSPFSCPSLSHPCLFPALSPSLLPLYHTPPSLTPLSPLSSLSPLLSPSLSHAGRWSRDSSAWICCHIWNWRWRDRTWHDDMTWRHDMTRITFIYILWTLQMHSFSPPDIHSLNTSHPSICLPQAKVFYFVTAFITCGMTGIWIAFKRYGRKHKLFWPRFSEDSRKRTSNFAEYSKKNGLGRNYGLFDLTHI